ncbi:MAG: mechanosensitive ion channel family protein [Ilumatobacteraceae bacterium]
MINNSSLWAVVIIAVVPLAVLGAAEFDERLRQRDSPLRGALRTVRTWALPFFAIWAVLRPVLGRDTDALGVQLASTALIVALGAAALRVLRVLVARVAGRPRSDGRGPVPQLVLATPRIALLLILAWLVLSGVWDVNLSGLLTALGVTSLVVSFALQDTLSGLASGFLLLSDQPFQPGDWIISEGTEGMVIDLNWRTTRIRTRNGDMVIVPNSLLAKANIVNYTAPEPVHRIVVPIQVAFSNPPTMAKEMLLAAARETAGVLADPPPNVRVVSIDDPLMGYEVDLWVDDYAFAPRVQSDFGSLVWYQSHRLGVPLPSPAQDLYLHDAAATAEAARPTPASIRAGLQHSPLLALLDDGDIDRLVPASRFARFAAGELMVESGRSARDVMVLLEGKALLVLIETGADESIVGDIGDGETIGILESPPGEGRTLAVRATTDCEVLIIEAAAASEITSRNAGLAAAFNRLREIRARRVDRLLQARATLAAAEAASTPPIAATVGDTEPESTA